MLTADVKEDESLAARIDISRYSNYTRLLRVTARVLAVFQKKRTPSLSNALLAPQAEDLEAAEMFWIREAQKSIKQDLEEGKYRRLCPKTRADGIVVVGSRAEEWLEMSYNNCEVILLPYKHRFSRLYVEFVHKQGHLGTAATTSKTRSRFWITNLQKLAKSVKYNCVVCKKLEKRPMQQVMGSLPEERLKPSPPWYCTGVDLFGPFITRGEVQKRVRGKAYGVLFNCMTTRAVHVDVSDTYSTDGFMRVLRRFIALRGCPVKLYSDGGSQLVAANKQLETISKAWNWDELEAFGAGKVEVAYKNPNSGAVKGCTVVQRPVQRLVLISPADGKPKD